MVPSLGPRTTLVRVYEQILVGTDGSTTASRAVSKAVALAQATGATLTIATAGSGPRAAEILEAAAASHAGTAVELHTKVIPGDAASALVEEAENGYDLLVVGNLGMTGATRFLLGSVPDKISHHAPCALLIVHTT